MERSMRAGRSMWLSFRKSVRPSERKSA
jgi:hypothetical protein